MAKSGGSTRTSSSGNPTAVGGRNNNQQSSVQSAMKGHAKVLADAGYIMDARDINDANVVRNIVNFNDFNNGYMRDGFGEFVGEAGGTKVAQAVLSVVSGQDVSIKQKDNGYEIRSSAFAPDDYVSLRNGFYGETASFFQRGDKRQDMRGQRAMNEHEVQTMNDLVKILKRGKA